MDKLNNLYKNNKATFIYLLTTYIFTYLYLIYWSLIGGFLGAIPFWIVISFFFYPLFYIFKDKRISKERKIGWIILILIFNWLAFAFYLIKKKD